MSQTNSTEAEQAASVSPKRRAAAAMVVQRGEVLRTVVGSGVHGIAIEGTDDHDEMGVFVEPPDHVLGLSGPLDHHTWRSQPEGVRSGPGDVDLVQYSLRKYIRLTVKGNPTVLLPLYAPETDVLVCTKLGAELRDLTPSIVSQQAGQRFLGYLRGQVERMNGGGKRNRVPNRPELVERYGFDTKYASHALRLAIQGWELMAEGRLTLPMREEHRQQVLAVKTGQWSLDKARHEIKLYERGLLDTLALGDSPLPVQPDIRRVNTWLIQAHARAWRDDQTWRGSGLRVRT